MDIHNLSLPARKASFASVALLLHAILLTTAGGEWDDAPGGESTSRTETEETALWVASVEGMRKANLTGPGTQVDLRFLSSVKLDSATVERRAQSHLPPKIRKTRIRHLHQVGLAPGDITRSAQCDGRRGAPPPPGAKQEWLASFPAYCDSLSRVATIAFETPRPLDIGFSCRAEDVVYGDPDPPPTDDETRLVRAVRITGASWGRYDLRIDAPANRGRWTVTTICEGLVISS
jgi:hypothetical protein